MRNRKGIEEELDECLRDQDVPEITASACVLMLEVLLDIREMLADKSGRYI